MQEHIYNIIYIYIYIYNMIIILTNRRYEYMRYEHVSRDTEYYVMEEIS